MEIMVAWFPMLKALISVASILVVGILAYYKHYRTAGVLFVLLTVFTIFAPVAYDGTNTHSAHRAEVGKVEAYQTAHSSNNPEMKVVHTKELTFEEKMAIEDARSKAANQEITDEITQ